MRLFFAIELPVQVQRVLARLKTNETPDYRWVDPSLLHLTLAFLGEQPEERLPDLERLGTDAARHSGRGTLRLGEAGHFGARRAPRVLWVDLHGDLDTLVGLQRKLDAGLRQYGFPTEDRPFRAHIT